VVVVVYLSIYAYGIPTFPQETQTYL